MVTIGARGKGGGRVPCDAQVNHGGAAPRLTDALPHGDAQQTVSEAHSHLQHAASEPFSSFPIPSFLILSFPIPSFPIPPNLRSHLLTGVKIIPSEPLQFWETDNGCFARALSNNFHPTTPPPPWFNDQQSKYTGD